MPGILIGFDAAMAFHKRQAAGHLSVRTGIKNW